MQLSDRIAKIIKESKAQFISVTFTKADGSQRQLTFNPKDINDIKGTGSPCTKPNIFRIRDVKLGQWRSFDAARVVTIKANGRTYTQEDLK